MRIRNVTNHRRMMCLLLICAVWSLAIMMLLWKQIKESEDFNGERLASGYAKKLKYLDFRFNVIKIKEQLDRLQHARKVRESLENAVDEMEEGETSGNNNREEEHIIYHKTSTGLKIRSTRKAKVDYGQDRDVQVEGVNDYLMWHENFQNKQALPMLPRQKKCKSPANNIAFLKTHFTGSNVLTNILNRYGDLNNLNIALPSDGLSTFMWPMRFQWKYIDITLLNGSLPNIVANHARYNYDIMDNILYPGSVYITLLRDPVTQLETTFNNLNFGSLLEIWNTTDQLGDFLGDPKFYIRRAIKRKRFKDTLNLIKNGQFFDLGLSTTDYHRTNVIKQAIQELYDKFSLVLIYEHLDESLVLLKRRLCWQLDDILYLKFHHTSENTWNSKDISDDLRQRIKKWNQADVKLYEFFNASLWTEIGYEGEDYWRELREFRQMQENIEKDCLDGTGTVKEDKFSLDEDLLLGENSTNKIGDARGIFMKTLRGEEYSSNDIAFQSGDGMPITMGTHTANKFELHKRKFLGRLLTDEEAEDPDDEGSGDISLTYPTKGITMTTEKMAVSQSASNWNQHFCGKLLLDEQQYLNYFRKKQAYAKSSIKHP